MYVSMFLMNLFFIVTIPLTFMSMNCNHHTHMYIYAYIPSLLPICPSYIFPRTTDSPCLL